MCSAPTVKEVLSKISGVLEGEMDKIFAEVKANHATLNGCVRPHSFELVGGGKHKERCTKCGGTVDTIHAIWYRQGLEDGKK